MKYVSSFCGLKGPETPCAVFFDDLLENIPDITSVDDLYAVRYARTSTGYGDQLNPVRGQTGDKYYATFLKQQHKGTDLYDNCSMLDQLTTYGPIGALTSGGSYDMLTATYLQPGQYARQIVLNPFDDSYLFRSEATMYGGSKSNFNEVFFVYDGSTLEEASYHYPKGISGYNNPFYVEFSPDVLYADTPVSFSSIVHRDGGLATVGEGRMYYDGSIVPEEESVNLDNALVVLSTSVYHMKRDVEYFVDADLVPGSRPNITFTQTHTEL